MSKILKAAYVQISTEMGETSTGALRLGGWDIKQIPWFKSCQSQSVAVSRKESIFIPLSTIAAVPTGVRNSVSQVALQLPFILIGSPTFVQPRTVNEDDDALPAARIFLRAEASDWEVQTFVSTSSPQRDCVDAQFVFGNKWLTDGNYAVK